MTIATMRWLSHFHCFISRFGLYLIAFGGAKSGILYALCRRRCEPAAMAVKKDEIKP